jgi:transcriptional regulator NrdR family protein
MWCPRCLNETTKVVATSKGIINERYRRCPKCSYSWTTIEAIKTDKYWEQYKQETIKIESKDPSLFDDIEDY